MVHKENKCWCVFRSSKFSSCATQVETTLLFYHDLESYELYDNNDSQVQQELVQKIWKVFKTILEEAMELLWLVHMWLSKQDKFLRRTLIAMDHKISYVAPYCVLLLTLDLLSSKRDIGIIVHLEKSVLYLRQNIGMLMIGVPHSNQQHWAERARGWRKRQWAASARVC
ncbi:hypothetical protein CFC21_052895 [Triticum aestivum]|uniref:Uncharacterized protein n=3 Tax=Triticum TaxID=4564 RepID=A0A9R0VZR6_TRITD|nr:hypothetical protein CFC21_052895 [Triticum aestivum]VAH93516.1 unnamed protein product [Triticum turgidum subsp. durum]